MKLIKGDYSYGEPKIVGGHGRVVAGKYTSIADGVRIITVGHGIDNISTFPFNSKHMWMHFPEAKDIPGHPTHKGDVIIGNDCWIGYEAMILSGVKIRDGAVVAARSVVINDVEPYEVVAGVPALHRKYRFGPMTIEALMKIKWWDWPEEKIRENIQWFCQNNINEFVDKFLEK